MIGAVFCGWNGTLFEDTRLSWASVVAIYKHFGLPVPPRRAFLNAIGPDFMKTYQLFGMPKTVQPEELGAIRQRYFEEHWHEADLREGALEFLRWCKVEGVSVAIVSAELPEIIAKRCSDLKIIGYIDHIYAYAIQKQPVLRNALKRFSLEPHQGIYVTDTEDNILAAKAERIWTIGITNGYRSRKQIVAAKPDFPNKQFRHIQSFHAVRKIVEGLRNGGS
jgi:beta-phosphoglucomutase-like phosphatase (HAD superfamily)